MSDDDGRPPHEPAPGSGADPERTLDGRPGAPEPRRIAHFVLDEEIGRGGMGTVYLATNTILHRQEALKVLDLDSPGLDPVAADRFEDEWRLAAAASAHGRGNLVPIYSAGREPDVVWLSMEYVRGRSLDRLLADIGPQLTLKAVLSVLGPISEALDALHHEAGIVHRDVKPANIIVREDRTPVLVDFGIAREVSSELRHTGTGTIVGSLLYMAPEALRVGAEVGPEADQYSLASVAYEMLTGSPPRQVESTLAMVSRAQNFVPTPPSEFNAGVGPAVDRVLLRALSTDPRDRWASCTEFMRALARAGRDGAGTVVDEVGRPPSVEFPPVTGAIAQQIPGPGGYGSMAVHGGVAGPVAPAHRRPVGLIVAAALAVVAVIAAGVFAWVVTRPWSGAEAMVAGEVPSMVGTGPHDGGYGDTRCAAASGVSGAQGAIACSGEVPFTVYGFASDEVRTGAFSTYAAGRPTAETVAAAGCQVRLARVAEADGVTTVLAAPASRPVFYVVDVPATAGTPHDWVARAPIC